MTISEENYLKIIYHLSVVSTKEISTNAIAEKLSTKASSVTDMLKKLAEKELIFYQKYKGVSLSPKGVLTAAMIVRKHRLWEVFLVQKLGFSWDEVHEIAEELEHIKSDKLIDKLDSFLDYPTFDPHGDPIPNKNGVVTSMDKMLLSEAKIGSNYLCVGVKNSSVEFLLHLDKLKIKLGDRFEVLSKENFDASLTLNLQDSKISVSNKTAENLYIKNIFNHEQFT